MGKTCAVSLISGKNTLKVLQSLGRLILRNSEESIKLRKYILGAVGNEPARADLFLTLILGISCLSVRVDSLKIEPK